MDLLSRWTGYLIHHSAVSDDLVLSDFEAIRKYHMSWRHEGNAITEEQAKALISAGHSDVLAPSRDIGYHKVTESVKGKYTTQSGRPLWCRGAHEPAVNSAYLGHCFVGNFDKERPSPYMYDEGAKEISRLMVICPNISTERIEPHHNYSAKSCPGILFDMNELILRVRFYLGRG
jgi:hypothetical protein